MDEKRLYEFIKKIVINTLEEYKQFEKEKEEKKLSEKANGDEIPSLMVDGQIIKYNPNNKTYTVISQEESNVGIMCGKDEGPWSDGKLFGCKRNK